jgi:hypothetical protein
MKEYTINELLLKRIERIELLISVYQDRDRVRLDKLLAELDALNMQYLDGMVA